MIRAVPIYDYRCDACGHAFSAVRSYTDPAVDRCPNCGERPRKLMASPAIVFRGSGWYKTDSRAASRSSADTADTKESDASKEGGGGKEPKDAKDPKDAKEPKESRAPTEGREAKPAAAGGETRAGADRKEGSGAAPKAPEAKRSESGSSGTPAGRDGPGKAGARERSS